jgi:hypothetical protein
MAFDEDMAGMDCAQEGNPNACLQQCTANDQSTGQNQIFVAEIPQAGVLVVITLVDFTVRLSKSVINLGHPPGPPPSIRFCSFQI